MATGKIHRFMGSSKMADGFLSKVVAPRNPKLVRETEKSLTPSAFLKEMSLTTKQRLASTREMKRPQIIQLLDMSEASHQKFSAVDLEQSLFQPFPSEVIFQSYVPCKVYEVPLTLRNKDKVPRLVKVVLESSPYFRLVSPSDVCRKVAPGMPSTFRILFTPEENKKLLNRILLLSSETQTRNCKVNLLPNSVLAKVSIRMSLGSLIAPDTVEKRGLLRRPKNHKAIDMEAFEGAVEQNILKRKAQNYLVDSQTASGIQSAMLTSDAEIMLNNTELFIQPQFEKQNQNKLSALELQLLDSKTSAQRSKISDAAQEEAGLVSSVGPKKGKTDRYSEDLVLDRECVDRVTRRSPRTPVKQQEDAQERSQQSNPTDQLSASEEMVAGTAEHRANAGYSEHLEKKLSKKTESQITAAEDARVETETSLSEEEEAAEGRVEHQGSPEAELVLGSVGAGSLGRHSHAFSSEKSGTKPLEESVEQADELGDEAVILKWDGPRKEPTEGEAEMEDPESEEVSMKTPAFVHAAAYKPLLSTPRPAKPAAPKSPLQPLQAKPVPKGSRASRRKTCEPEIARSLIKKIFSHYAKMPVARHAFKIVEKCATRYFKQLSSDLEAYTTHAHRKTVEKADLEVLMRRQGLVTDKMPLHVLIERYLPLEYRKLLIPMAVSGNKVIPPCK